LSSAGSAITFCNAKPSVLMYNKPFNPAKFFPFCGRKEMIKTDKVYMEKIIREELGMIKTGEKIYRFKE